jgi:hypothetical protein
MLRIGNDEPELVIFESFTNEPKVYLAKGALEAFGIQCTIDGDDCGGLRPHLAARGLRLIVRAEDACRAAEVLRVDAEDA